MNFEASWIIDNVELNGEIARYLDEAYFISLTYFLRFSNSLAKFLRKLIKLPEFEDVGYFGVLVKHLCSRFIAEGEHSFQYLNTRCIFRSFCIPVVWGPKLQIQKWLRRCLVVLQSTSQYKIVTSSLITRLTIMLYFIADCGRHCHYLIE